MLIELTEMIGSDAGTERLPPMAPNRRSIASSPQRTFSGMHMSSFSSSSPIFSSHSSSSAMSSIIAHMAGTSVSTKLGTLRAIPGLASAKVIMSSSPRWRTFSSRSAPATPKATESIESTCGRRKLASDSAIAMKLVRHSLAWVMSPEASASCSTAKQAGRCACSACWWARCSLSLTCSTMLSTALRQATRTASALGAHSAPPKTGCRGSSRHTCADPIRPLS